LLLLRFIFDIALQLGGLRRPPTYLQYIICSKLQAARQQQRILVAILAGHFSSKKAIIYRWLTYCTNRTLNSMYNDWPTFCFVVKKVDDLSSKLMKSNVEVHLFGMNVKSPSGVEGKAPCVEVVIS
jgi:hypothetical protein